MPRITVESPDSQGDIAHIGSLGTSYQVLFEAPDFSVPDENQEFPDRDPADPNDRAIRPGELFVGRPILVSNTSGAEVTLDVRITREDGTDLDVLVYTLPANSNGGIQLQGAALYKRTPANANGDRLLLRASAAGAVAVTGWYETRLASDHQT